MGVQPGESLRLVGRWGSHPRYGRQFEVSSFTTVLATLLIAESDGRLTSESLLLGRAVSGLRAVGLDSDAHALALEAALDAGI